MDKDNTINDSTASNIKTDINNTTKEINQRGTEIQYNSNLENEAYMLTRRAENKLNPGCCLDALFSSKSKRYEDACELYKKAGEKYNLQPEVRLQRLGQRRLPSLIDKTHTVFNGRKARRTPSQYTSCTQVVQDFLHFKLQILKLHMRLFRKTNSSCWLRQDCFAKSVLTTR